MGILYSPKPHYCNTPKPSRYVVGTIWQCDGGCSTLYELTRESGLGGAYWRRMTYEEGAQKLIDLHHAGKV